MGSTPTNEEVAIILEDLRSNKSQCPSSTMLGLTNYLMRNTVDACVEGGWHWFCKTPPTPLPTDDMIIDLDPLEPATLINEVATFTLTYHAYNASAPVRKWKSQLSSLLQRCTACVEGYDKAKLAVEEQYLSHHPSQVLRNFFLTVTKWEAEEIAILGSRPQVQPPQPNLSRLPPSLIHLLLLSPALTQIPSMHDMFVRASKSTFNSSDAESHLDGRFPAVGEGLLELLLQQPRSPPPASDEEDPPLESDIFPHLSVRNLAKLLLPPVKSITLPGLAKSLPTIERLLAVISSSSSDAGANFGEAWEVLSLVLERLDGDALKMGLVGGFGGAGKDALERGDRWLDEVCGGRSRWTRTVGIVCSHLGEDSEYFPSIFSSFLTLLVASGGELWSTSSSPNSPTPPNPIVVLDSIRNNQQFLSLFETGERRCFEWFDVFVQTLSPSSEDPPRKDKVEEDPFQEGLKKTINFLAEGVQHSRFEISISIKAMTEVFRIISHASKATSSEPSSSSRRRAIHSVFEIYSSTIASVAYASKDHRDPAWSPLRSPAKKIFSLAFDEDASTIRTGALALASVLKPKDPSSETAIPSFDIRDSLWKSAYDGMATKRSDIEGLALLIRSVARFAHVEVLDSVDGAWRVGDVTGTLRRRGARTAIENLNESLVKTRSQFASAIERFGNVNNQETLLKLWNAPQVTSATLSLLLSPDEDIHEAIQALIQQSFSDVDDRADCFRVLLQNMPDQAMEGLITFLSTFVQSAQVFPEACSMAKWMVRCLTDVIDVLCRPPRGLLLDDVFVNHEGIPRLVQKLWRIMTESIALVFKSTMHWAAFYPNDVMVDWMRDALIFARLMVDMTRTFETAAVGGGTTSYYSIFNSQSSSSGPRSPTKMSTVGKGMVDSLNNVLGDLLSWLRLTDVETLHQTFELIKMILDRFHRSNMEPRPAYISRLQNFTNRASGHRCKLTDGQLAEISDMLAWWEDDDVVEIIQPMRSKSSLASSSLSRSGSSKEVEKAAWAKVLGSSSPAPQKPSKSATGSKPSSSSVPQKSWRGPGVVEKDEYDDEFPEFSELDLAAMDMGSSSSKLKPKPATTSSSRLGPSVPSKSQTIQLGPKFPTTSKLGKVPVPALKMGTIAGLRASVPAPKSSSSSKSGGGALGQLRSDFKSERKAVVKSKPLLQPTGMMKAGFSLSISNKSEIQPSPKKRRTDTQDSDSTATDSSDDEDEVRGLAAFSQAVHQKPPVAARVMPPPTRTIKFMADEIAIKSPAEKRREAKELARRTLLRLKPDLESLHRAILQWDPKDTNSLPPNFSADSLQKIPPQFDSADQYLRILEPLLMLECWAQVQKAVEDSRNEARITCELAGRMNVDDWIDIEFSIAPAEIKQGYYLNDVDVVQIYSSMPGGGKPLFAKVVKYKKTFKDIQLNLRFHNSRDLRPFTSRSKWVLQKVVNLSTMHREYGGLHGMPYYDRMLPSILKSDSFPLIEPSARALDDAMSAYAVNRPQAKAILGAMNTNTSGFVLIQGPPGTGKTKTICGLVGKFLSDRVEPATRIRPGQQTRPEDAQPSLKILVCAPSNAAIDEVTKRLRDGIRSSAGKTITPKIVRIGNDSSINIAVKDVSLDELVDQKLRGSSVLASGDGAAEMARIRTEVDAAQAARIVVEKKLQDVYSSGGDTSEVPAFEEEIKRYKTKRARLMQELNKAKDAQKDSSRSLDAARRKARQDVVFEADIICCTLSGAGHDLLGSFNFETVIIDEAAQAVELSALIPLKYQCRRCIMVGDPNQLPPTVMSQAAEKYNYSESMFVRIQRKSPHNVHLLSIQYRMHPDISVLPSRVFYNGELEDGPDMASKTAQVWHSSNAFSPYRFINVNSSREMSGNHGHSLKNEVEVEVALSLYKNLKDQFPRVDFDYRIGIVTMYKEQKMALIRRFQKIFGYDIVSRIDFNTVDGFQGQEKDIIILSCVRAGPPGSTAGVGFLKDSRRMNVALTRARSSLFIIGHAPTLEGGGPQWKGIVNDARSRNALVDYHPNVFQPSRAAIASAPTAPKADRAALPPPPPPPPPPPEPSAAPPPLPPMQTPKEMSAARKELKKERKENKRRATSPSANGNGNGNSVPSKETGDLEPKKKKIKRSKEEKKGDGKDWVEKMKDVESDSDSDAPRPLPAAGPSTASTLNPPQKRKLDESTSSNPPPVLPSYSKPTNGSSSSSKPVPAAPPPPPPAPAPPVSKAPPLPKPPPRPKAPPNLFMPSKRKPVKPQGGNASSTSSGAGPSTGGSARAKFQAQALTGLPPQPPPRK